MKKRFNKALSLTLCLALSASIMSPALAAESNATQTSPVKLTVQPVVFNVAVPSGLPVDVDSKGEVTVATNVKIENHSAAPISIAGVQVNPIPDWSIVPMNKDFKGSKIGTKEFGFILNNDEVPANGTVALTNSNWPSINGGSNLPLTYNSIVAPQKDAINSNKIADVVFTIGWDVNDFALSSESLSIEKGGSSKLNLLGVDSAVWSSSNESVATVDQTGLVTPLDWGTTTITATANGVSKSCEVTVPKVFNGLTLNTNNVELYETQTQQLTATDKYRSATTWSSNNESVATVSSTGLVTAKSAGTAIITATKGGFSAECSVKVNPIMLSNTTLSIEKGKTSQLTLSSGLTAIWSSSNESVATVDQTGNITAIDWGTTTVSATIGGIVLSCEVTVPKIQTGLELDITSRTLKPNETVQLTATSKFRAGTVWTSSNPEIATVSTSGLVTGVSEGTTTITATQGGFTATCNITVNKYVLATDADFSGTTDGTFQYIGTDDYVVIPHVIKGVPVTSYREMFSETNIKGVKSTNTNVTNMQSMFSVSRAAILDLSSFDTSNVTNMSFMFCNSKATSIIGLSSFDTSKVENMSFMFAGTHASLNLSSFNTSNVTNMSKMFMDCRAASLDLSNFDTSNVTDMREMFRACIVTVLDLSNFDIANVVTMSGIFMDCLATTGYARTEADANKFNTWSELPPKLTFVVKDGLELSSKNLTIYKLKTAQLTATSKVSGNIIWTSSNDSVATVNSSGLITGVSLGSATITATQGAYSDTCNVKVVYGGTGGV